jgi:hypothetical protein
VETEIEITQIEIETIVIEETIGIEKAGNRGKQSETEEIETTAERE